MNSPIQTKKHILVIDDDPRNIFALGMVLKSRGYHFIASKDAAGGLHILQTDASIGIVLIDMMMPEMDGYEAMSCIRKMENRKNIPLIAITGQAMKGDREKCLAAGANDYLSKPVDIDRLESILKTHLGY